MTLFDWTPEENLVFSNKYLREIVMQAPIKQNAKEIIEKIKNEGNEIYIITARSEPRFIDPYGATKEQLDKNGIPYDKIIVNCAEKYDYCKENKIELMLDDEPENVNLISKIIPVIAFKESYNEIIFFSVLFGSSFNKSFEATVSPFVVSKHSSLR